MLGDFVRGDINASAEPGGFNCLLKQGNHSQSRAALSSIYFRAKLAFILLRQPLVAFDGIISTPKALRPPRLLAASSSELNNHAPSERPQIHGGETPFPFPAAAAQGPLLAPSACTARAHSEPGAGAGSQHDAPGMHDLLLPLQRARCCCLSSAGSEAVWRCAGTPKHLGDFGGDQEEKGVRLPAGVKKHQCKAIG